MLGLGVGEAMLDLSSTDFPQSRTPDERLGNIHVLLAAPRGFCAGVTRAIDAVREALARHGAPVYVRRPIVHNMEVVRSLEAEGAIFVEELDQVPSGAVVMFSAHGVAPSVAADASKRGLIAHDAVCPLVAKVHREVERHQRAGRVVILIGHQGHPEIEGTLGHIDADRSFVVTSPSDVSSLPLEDDTPAAYAIQTTYAVDEAKRIVDALRDKFTDLAGPSSSDICYATTNRQNAVRAVASRADAMIVVGESFSSNARRLAEVAAQHCSSVQLVAQPGAIDWSLLPVSGVVGISAAASTPDTSIQAVIHALSRKHRLTIDQVETMRETAVFKPLEFS